MPDQSWIEGKVREALHNDLHLDVGPDTFIDGNALRHVARAVAVAVVRTMLDAYENTPYPTDDVDGTYVALRSGLVGRASELGLTGERGGS